MSRINKLPNAVQAIHGAVAESRITHADERNYDGHDIINWLNDHRNNELNDVIDLYSNTADPVHYATIQIGRFLKNQLNQDKIGERISNRRITLRDGSMRNGTCDVSVWQI